MERLHEVPGFDAIQQHRLDRGLVKEAHHAPVGMLPGQEAAELAPLLACLLEVLDNCHCIAVIGRHPPTQVLEVRHRLQGGVAGCKLQRKVLIQDNHLSAGLPVAPSISSLAQFTGLVGSVWQWALETTSLTSRMHLFFDDCHRASVVAEEEVLLNVCVCVSPFYRPLRAIRLGL